MLTDEQIASLDHFVSDFDEVLVPCFLVFMGLIYF